MNAAVEATPFDAPSAPNRFMPVLGMAGATLAMVACSVYPGAAQPATSAEAGKRGPCVPSPPEDAARAAERCRIALEGGRVALVTYGVPQDSAAAVGKRIEAMVPRATGDIAHMLVSVVPFTPAATAALREATGERDCIDIADPTKYVAAAADKKMPLQDSHFVVGLSNEKSCTPGVGGVANTTGGRLADVLMGEGVDPSSEDFVNKAAAIAVHELLHLLGLGHSGRVLYDKTNLNGDMSQRIGRLFDLLAYLRDYTYQEYGGGASDVMSNTGGGRYIFPNILHIELLRQPAITLGADESRAQPLGTEWRSYDVDDLVTGTFATIKLATPVSLVDQSVVEATKGHVAGAHTFDTLALVPAGNELENGVTGLELVLYDSLGHNTASLGVLGEDGSGRISRITYGSQVIELQADNAMVRMHAV